MEYELLRALSLNAGRVVTYDDLLRKVWSGREAGDVDLVRNFVKKLRAKLGEDARSPTWIFNLRGVGYRMPRPARAVSAGARIRTIDDPRPGPPDPRSGEQTIGRGSAVPYAPAAMAAGPAAFQPTMAARRGGPSPRNPARLTPQRTLDGYRVSGAGPASTGFGNRARYLRSNLDGWAAKRRATTTAEADRLKAA